MIPLSFALMFVLGLVIHRLCFKRLTATSPNLDIFEARGLMVSFGLMFLVQNFVSWVWGGDLRGYDYLTEPVQIGGAQFAANKLLVLALSLLFAAALIVLLRITLLGKGVRALMQSPTGAQLVGIDTARLHPLMFGIGLGLSGVAGCLLSMTYTITPSMGEPYTVTALIVITLGGFGSMGGALAGGLLLGVIEALGMHFTNPSLKALLSYGVFIAVLLLRPKGCSPQAMNRSPAPDPRPAGALRPHRLGAVPSPPYGSEFVVSHGADLPDVRGAVVELGAVLRHHALPVAGHLGLLRHRRLHQRAGAGADWAGPQAIALGAGIAAARGGGHGRGGAAPARHLLRGADLRHDRADPPRHHLLGKAGHRHRRPRAHGGARARHHLPDGAADRGAGGGHLHRACGARASAWRCAASARTSSARRRWA